MTEGENLTKFELFCKDIEKEKEEARKWSWFILIQAGKGMEVSQTQMNAINNILDRMEGKAKQPLVGDKENPLIFQNLNDDELNGRIKKVEDRIAVVEGGKVAPGSKEKS